MGGIGFVPVQVMVKAIWLGVAPNRLMAPVTLAASVSGPCSGRYESITTYVGHEG